MAWDGKNPSLTFPNSSLSSTQGGQTAPSHLQLCGDQCLRGPTCLRHRAPASWPLCRASGAWPHLARKGPWALSDGCTSSGISTKRISKHERQGRLPREPTLYRNMLDAINETEQQFWPHQKYVLLDIKHGLTPRIRRA